MIATVSVAGYLQRLASGAPTPGGGAAGALHAAQGAALASMVAEFTSGARYRDVEAEAARIAERAQRCLSTAVHAAEEDERLFAGLIAAYRLPKQEPSQQAERSAAIQHATLAATAPQVATVEVAAEVLELATRLLEIGNRSVISDVAAAAEAARAGAATALVTLELNINTLADAPARERLGITARRAEEAMITAEHLARQVRTVVAA